MIISRFRSQILPFLRAHLCLFAGGLLGLLLGWYGLVFGAILGAIVDVLRNQGSSDRSILSWMENPGSHRILEPVPGITAFCALAVIFLLENRRRKGGPLSAGFDEASVVWKTGLLASTLSISLPEHRALLENLARMAVSIADTLNPDLLVECLASQRRGRGDLSSWLSLLAPLCDSPGSRRLFDRLVRDIDPAHSLDQEDSFGRGASWKIGLDSEEAVLDKEAWKIMGIREGSSRRELGKVYRRLARQFHPDTLFGLDEEHLRQAANAFLRIDGAYRRLSGTGRLAVSPSRGGQV